MRQKSGPEKQPAEDASGTFGARPVDSFSAEEKIRVVLEGLRGEESMADSAAVRASPAMMSYGWSKKFLEAGKRRLAGDAARAATSEVWRLQTMLPAAQSPPPNHRETANAPRQRISRLYGTY